MPSIAPKPFWQTADQKTVRLYQGDTRAVLRRLPEKSVHCVVTSPPYWALRDYQVAGQLGSESSPDCGTMGQAQCGDCFVCSMVSVFREVYRVLRDDGTLWLNLGDSYNSNTGIGFNANAYKGNQSPARLETAKQQLKNRPKLGMPSGNLVGIPWRVALALQNDGWILRQDIIWHKPSPMPESAKNRCTKAHEYVFLFAKRSGYFYDAEAIKETADTADLPPRTLGKKQSETEFDGMISHNEDHARAVLERVPRRNRRSVWNVASQGYPGAHFATYPPKLIEPMILAGTSERGCCTDCGTPWKRVSLEEKLFRERPNDYVKRTGEEGTGNSCPNTVAGVSTEELGWYPGCDCLGLPAIPKEPAVGKNWNSEKAAQEKLIQGSDSGKAVHDSDRRNGIRQSQERSKWSGEVARLCERAAIYETVPCTVLDPFVGSGTTCAVALANGRRSIGIDLSADYLRENAVVRIEGEILQRPALSELKNRTAEAVTGVKPLS